MPQLTTRRTRAAAAASITALVAGLSLAATGPASADTSNNLTITYDASGSSTLVKPQSTVALGPTVLTASLSPADGSFTGHLPLPDTQSTFKVLGLVPVTATVSFIEAGPVRGKLITRGRTQLIRSKARYIIKLTNVKVGGIPALQGDKCQTAAPVVIPANTPAGQKFNITTGGNLQGTYTLGDFANCGLTTGIINQLVPGPGNTADITISNGQIQQ